MQNINGRKRRIMWSCSALGALMALCAPGLAIAAGICAADSTSKLGARVKVSGTITHIAPGAKSFLLKDEKCEMLVEVSTLPATCRTNAQASVTATVVKAKPDDWSLVNLRALETTCH